MGAQDPRVGSEVRGARLRLVSISEEGPAELWRTWLWFDAFWVAQKTTQSGVSRHAEDHRRILQRHIQHVHCVARGLLYH